MSSERENNLTFEHLESANITIFQSKKGYRYGEESLKLLEICSVTDEDIILDMGAGCGIIGLTIKGRHNPKEIILIEIQKSLAKIIEHNIQFNKLKNIELVNNDYRTISNNYKSYFTKIFCNPPFTPLNEGQKSKNEERNNARMEINGTLKETLKSAHLMLKNDGSFYIVLPETRNDEFNEIIKSNFCIEKKINSKTLNYYALKKLC